MKHFFGLIIFLLIGLVPGYAGGSSEGIKGNGNVTTQERTAVNFDGLVLEAVANVTIHFDAAYKVVVVTDSNIQEYLTIKVIDNLLYIDIEKQLNLKKFIQIDVYMPEIKSINSQGVGNITLDKGSGKSMEIVLSGVGNIDAQNYHIEEINIDQSGVGSIKVWGDTINGELSGVGNISYKGNPILNIDRSGVGRIKKL